MKCYRLEDPLRKFTTYRFLHLLGLTLALAALGGWAGGEENDPPASIADAQGAVTAPIRFNRVACNQRNGCYRRSRQQSIMEFRCP
jgi:hypothetical protein